LPAEQFDPNLNLYYNRARYLATTTGRFWSTDSYEGNARDPLSLHKYLYASSDPPNRIDPSGHEDVSLVSFSVTVAISTTIGAISGYNADRSLSGAVIGGLRGARNGALVFAAGAGLGLALVRVAPLLAGISSYAGPVLGFVAKVLGITETTSGAAPAVAGTVKLWRAVGENELDDVPLIMVGGIDNPFGRNFVTTDIIFLPKWRKQNLRCQQNLKWESTSSSSRMEMA